jgi:hypothetical protein
VITSTGRIRTPVGFRNMARGREPKPDLSDPGQVRIGNLDAEASKSLRLASSGNACLRGLQMTHELIKRRS